MRKLFVFVILLITFISLACSSSTPVPVATLAPTNTPAPTATFTPVPTNTPVPQVPGVNAPLKYVGIGFTVSKVESLPSWLVDGEANYPTLAGDVFLAVTFDIEGDLFTLVVPQNEDSERTFHIHDNFDRVDQWALYEAAEDGSTFTLIFVVDGSARNYIFSFPNGQEVDLASFLG